MKRLPMGYTLRKDGRYQHRFTYDKTQYCVYGLTIEECEIKKQRKIESIKKEQSLFCEDMTLEEYYDIWLEEQKKVVKKSTVYSYEKYWKWIRKTIGKCSLSKINKMTILKMQNELKNEHSYYTVNRAHKLLSSILRSALNDRLIDFNPAPTVRQLKSNKMKATDTNHRALTLEEQAKFFKYAKGTHYYNLYRLLIATGMRVGEALALTWKDIDFEKMVIHITKTVMKVGNSEWELSDTPKNDNSNRTIPITPLVESILMDQKSGQSSQQVLKFKRFIFTTDEGNMSNYNNVDSAIKRVLTKMDLDNNRIEHFSVHAFRATFATRCIEQGMQPKTLQVILGHASLKMTMDLYAHVLPNTKAEELARVDFLFDTEFDTATASEA